MDEDLIELPDGRLYRFWGSDCAECGNTTPASMRCDQCQSTDHTLRLLIEIPV